MIWKIAFTLLSIDGNLSYNAYLNSQKNHTNLYNNSLTKFPYSTRVSILSYLSPNQTSNFILLINKYILKYIN